MLLLFLDRFCTYCDQLYKYKFQRHLTTEKHKTTVVMMSPAGKQDNSVTISNPSQGFTYEEGYEDSNSENTSFFFNNDDDVSSHTSSPGCIGMMHAIPSWYGDQ